MRNTHVDDQISNLNVGASNHGVREIGLDGDGIPEAEEVPLLREVVDVYLSADDDLRRHDVDSYLYVEIAHLRFDVRVVFGNGPAHLSAW